MQPSSNWVRSSLSSSTNLLDRPSRIMHCWTYSMWSSNSYLIWWMFQKYSLFDFFIWAFKNLIFYWNWCIIEPSRGVASYHHYWEFYKKEGSLRKKLSKRKGLLFGLALISTSKLMDQWYDMQQRRIKTSTKVSLSQGDFETKNMSNPEVIWGKPPFQLFQVNIPCIVSAYVACRSCMRSRKRRALESSYCKPPFLLPSI